MPTDRWKLDEPARRKTVTLAHEFRGLPTRSEDILWRALRRKQLDGVKFRRQCPVGPFVVDFLAPAHRLVIKVDGPIHDKQIERDRERQGAIEGLGFRFLRVSSKDVEQGLDGVLGKIRVAVKFPPP